MNAGYRRDAHLYEIPRKQQAQKNITTLLVHIALWLVFLSLPAVFNPHRHDHSLWRFADDLLEPPRWKNAVLLLIVFYTNYYFTIPRLYIQRRYFLFACTLICWIVVFLFVNYLITQHSMGHMHGRPEQFDPGMPGAMRDMHPPGPGRFNGPGNSFNLFMFITTYALSFALCIYEQWEHAKERMLTAEISFLKAQINPHFLFNTLNSIYSLALTKSDSAPDAIIKLSGMMRYSVSEGNQNVVTLPKELSYISDYVSLQKLRLTDKVKISYMLNGEAEGKQIAPFLLIPFVENAFKYGVNSEENSDIRISIQLTGNMLNLEVVNNKVYSRQDKDTGIGLGVQTTRKRLQLLYPGRHKLEIKDNPEDYTVSLQMLLT